jgi:hypothetical protein
MDFVHNLTAEINNIIADHDQLTTKQMAELITRAAEQTVETGATGQEFPDVLKRPQLGLLLLALQWNTVPEIRRAVRR